MSCTRRRAALVRRTMLVLPLLLLALVASGCGGPDEASTAPRPRPGPTVTSGPLSAATSGAVSRLFANMTSYFDTTALAEIGAAGDARMAWLTGDLLRLFHDEISAAALVEVFETLTAAELSPTELGDPWRSMTERMLEWDLPAPPGYATMKGRLFALVEPGWRPFFSDPAAEIDWRRVNWGGVLMDDRPLGDPSPCREGCIPALDDPAVTSAAGGSWYPDDGVVFGVVVGDEARAYPRNVMTVHEMVNDTLGGRRIGLPYCTLCGSAQAYHTDSAGDPPLVLRTSGLLVRSNKITYDLRTRSLIDTFTGRALTGPLRRRGVRLEQITVTTTTWADWKERHPRTTIVAEDGGIGRRYPVDRRPVRSDAETAFPVGEIDPRLRPHEQVLGVVATDGTPVAFPVADAIAALRSGRPVRLRGVRVELDAGGLRAMGGAGVVGHEAFWFAWSQFHPGTVVWKEAREE